MNYQGMKLVFNECVPENELWFIHPEKLPYARFAKEEKMDRPVEGEPFEDAHEKILKLFDAVEELEGVVYAMNKKEIPSYFDKVQRWMSNRKGECGCKLLQDGDTWKTVWHEGSVVCKLCGDPMP